jgi:hypothetical protein
MHTNIKIPWIAIILGVFAIGTVMAGSIDYANMKPTQELIKEAKANPNGWVYVIEGNYGPNDEVPPHAIAGAWQVDDAGMIIEGSFRANPNYQSK